MIALPPCFACAHYDSESGKVCAAFPDGIPTTILVKGKSHDTPRGDEVDGIVFELDPAKQNAYELYRQMHLRR